MHMLLLSLLMAFSPVSAQTPDANAIFSGGQTYQDFLAAADARPEVWKANTNRSHPSPDLVDRLKKAGEGLRFIVVAVAACSDSVHTVPYVATLADAAGIPLRIVTPAAGASIQAAYRTPDNRGATATVALVRGDRIVGAWVERPVALQTWMLGPGAALPQSERMERKFGWYEWDRGESTMAELVELVERLR